MSIAAIAMVSIAAMMTAGPAGRGRGRGTVLLPCLPKGASKRAALRGGATRAEVRKAEACKAKQPTRFAARSKLLLIHARAIKAAKRGGCRKSLLKVSDMYRKLSKAWNQRVGLRFGDKAQKLELTTRTTASGRRCRTSRRKLDFDFCARAVYGYIGRAEVARGSVGQTRRGVDIMCGLAQLALRAQSMAMAAQFKPTEGCFLHVGFDATPVMVDFGKLGTELVEFSRFLVPREDRPGWRLVTLDAFRQLRGLLTPKYGVVELLGVTADVAWITAGQVRHEAIIAPPRILQRANGSTIWAALHRHCHALSELQLRDLASSCTCCILQECPDACKANLRKLAFTRSRLPP